MQAAGIGRGAAVVAVIDKDDALAFPRQFQRGAQTHDAAADDGDIGLGEGHGGPKATMSAIAIGFTGARGAKNARSSSGRPCVSLSHSASIGAQ